MSQVLAGNGPIVVVDDSEVDLVVARECYKRSRLDRELVALTGGEAFLSHLDAVEAGARPMPSLVLLDINMPGLDGFEVLRQTRARPAFTDLPIFVMLTNSDDPKDRQRARDAGATAFQTKPIQVEEYVEFFDSLAAR